MNKHALRASHRARAARIRKLAPRHPPGPESRMRLGCARLFQTFHKAIIKHITAGAPHHLAHYRGIYDRKTSEQGSQISQMAVQKMGISLYTSGHCGIISTPWRGYRSPQMGGESRWDHRFARYDVRNLLAAESNEDQTEKNPNPLMSSVFSQLHRYGKRLLSAGPYRGILNKSASQTAKSTNSQVKKALSITSNFEPDLSEQADTLTNNLYDSASYYIDKSMDRAESVLDEWTDLDPDLSPRYGNVDALDSMLTTGLLGILGSAVASVAIEFGDAFSNMVRESGTEAGVEKYTWIAQLDANTRPEHANLDGQQFDWDDPGLKAFESSSGEEEFPGGDYNCRCVSGLDSPTVLETN